MLNLTPQKDKHIDINFSPWGYTAIFLNETVEFFKKIFILIIIGLLVIFFQKKQKYLLIDEEIFSIDKIQELFSAKNIILFLVFIVFLQLSSNYFLYKRIKKLDNKIKVTIINRINNIFETNYNDDSELLFSTILSNSGYIIFAKIRIIQFIFNNIIELLLFSPILFTKSINRIILLLYYGFKILIFIKILINLREDFNKKVKDIFQLENYGKHFTEYFYNENIKDKLNVKLIFILNLILIFFLLFFNWEDYEFFLKNVVLYIKEVLQKRLTIESIKIIKEIPEAFSFLFLFTLFKAFEYFFLKENIDLKDITKGILIYSVLENFKRITGTININNRKINSLICDIKKDRLVNKVKIEEFALNFSIASNKITIFLDKNSYDKDFNIGLLISNGENVQVILKEKEKYFLNQLNFKSREKIKFFNNKYKLPKSISTGTIEKYFGKKALKDILNLFDLQREELDNIHYNQLNSRKKQKLKLLSIIREIGEKKSQFLILNKDLLNEIPEEIMIDLLKILQCKISIIIRTESLKEETYENLKDNLKIYKIKENSGKLILEE